MEKEVNHNDKVIIRKLLIKMEEEPMQNVLTESPNKNPKEKPSNDYGNVFIHLEIGIEKIIQNKRNPNN